MTPEPRHLLDTAPLRRILVVAALVMALIGAVEAVETARQARGISPQRIDDPPKSLEMPAQSGPDQAQDLSASPVEVPTLIERSLAFIEPFEGRRHRVYNDSLGHRTIGVGFNLDRSGAASDINMLLPGVSYRTLRRGDVSLTDAQIDVLFRHDVQRALATARRQVQGFEGLPDDAKLIVIDMTFNLGSLGKWRKFRAALLRNDFVSAADAMHRSLWRRQTGQRAIGHIELMNRLAQS
jgi:GH24 family phage-related lysozyme (muramidase)